MEEGQSSLPPQKPAIPKKDDYSGFRLTDRDYEIFKYLYDQKFCSLEVLYLIFFDQRENFGDPIPENMPAARQRLGILKRAGFVLTERVYSESKSVYLLSKTGFKALYEKYPLLTYGSPIQSVDFRNYEHDTRLNLIRVALERKGKAVKWYPERRIRIAGFKSKEVDYPLPDTILPDGIFLSSKGERIAVELELSVRKKSRFRFKIEEYDRVMQGENPLIHKVLFIVSLESLKKDLMELFEGRKHFLIEDFSHFAGSLNLKRAAEKESAEEEEEDPDVEQ